MSWLSDIFALPSAREQALLREQYRFLTRLVPVMYATIATVIVILAYLFRSDTPVWLGIVAPTAISLIIFTRASQWFRARAYADTISPDEMVKQCRRLVILAPVLSIGISAVLLGLMTSGDHSILLLSLVVI